MGHARSYVGYALYLVPVRACGVRLTRYMTGSRMVLLVSDMSILARMHHFWPSSDPEHISWNRARLSSTDSLLRREGLVMRVLCVRVGAEQARDSDTYHHSNYAPADALDTVVALVTHDLLYGVVHVPVAVHQHLHGVLEDL